MKVPASPVSAIHASNTLTYGSLLAGVCALAAALQDNAAACGSLLATAVIFDTFDGRFARRVRHRHPTPHQGPTCKDLAPAVSMHPAAEMGTQLDSLVDAVSFGMLPVVCASVLFDLDGAIWWGSAFVYVACAITRLGFYNISHAKTDGFIGLPAPVAALFWSSIFLFDADTSMLIGLCLSCAMAMIAPMPLPRPAGAALALFVAWPLGLIASHCARMLG